jgi:hypothetical protein
VVDEFEESTHTIYSAFKRLHSLDFGHDPVIIKNYLQSRLQKNEITDLVLQQLSNISPSLFVTLCGCPPTSVGVERSFSMLKKLLAKDRNFVVQTFLVT